MLQSPSKVMCRIQTPLKQNPLSQTKYSCNMLESVVSGKTRVSKYDEVSEKPDILKNSFVATQESLLELSSFINEQPILTMKQVIDLEEKRQVTRKALFQNRYLRKYQYDYKPKGLTTNKCFYFFEISLFFFSNLLISFRYHSRHK